MRGEDPAAWLRALADPSWLASSQLLKDEPGSSWVRRATINGRDVVVKCRYLNTLPRRLKSALGYGHGDKHWRGAARLAMKRIPTATPIVLARGIGEAQPCELIILNYLSGPTLLQVLDDIARGRGPSVRTQHAIAAAAGATIPTLLSARLWNRDHKPSNLIVLDADSASPRIALIDDVGLRRYGWMGIDGLEGEEMLASLGIEPLGCACFPRRALWMRAVHGWIMPDDRPLAPVDRRAVVHEIVRDASDLIAAHGNPRPKTNPLPRQSELNR